MEIWRAVIGYEGLYEVSDCGNVRRIGAWCDGRKTKPAEMLSGKVTKSGYKRVTLHRERDKHEFGVHRLVAAAFLGPLPSFIHQVNHKSGVKTDNRPENLEYVTPSVNQLHSYRVLGTPSRPGSKHHNAKLSENEVIELRSLRASGWHLKKLAVKFGISVPTVCWIAKRKSWTHI